MAGVLAHEISHVALRHGTAQATQGRQVPDRAGWRRDSRRDHRRQCRCSRVAASANSASARRSCATRASTRSRPTSSARRSWRGAATTRAPWRAMFRTIEQEGGGRAAGVAEQPPEPRQPGRVHHAGSADAARDKPVSDTREFQTCRRGCGRCRRRRRPKRLRDGAAGNRRSARGTTGTSAPTGRVERRRRATRPTTKATSSASACRRTGSEMASENQRDLRARRAAYGAINDQSVFTHGVQVGMARNENARPLQEATEELLASLAQANRGMSTPSGYTPWQHRRPPGLAHSVANDADTTGGASDAGHLHDRRSQDGTLFYMIGVAPGTGFATYQPVINKCRSVRSAFCDRDGGKRRG